MEGRKSSASNIKMQSVDALFGLEQDKGSPAEKVVDVAIDKLYPFNSHPFRVLDDEKMQETVESVREHGIPPTKKVIQMHGSKFFRSGFEIEDEHQGCVVFIIGKGITGEVFHTFKE